MKKPLLVAALLALGYVVFSYAQNSAPKNQLAPAVTGKVEVATFAGGCFWSMQTPFDHTNGVVSSAVGYTGGTEKNPTYEQVSSRTTGHRESVQVTFDPAQITYDQLLDVYWRSFNPTQANGQFADIGPQYRAAIFYHSAEQKRAAEQSRERLGKSGRFKLPIVTEILPASQFWPAEEEHQKYYQKNPVHYNLYEVGSGRAGFLKSIWGDEVKH